MLIKVSNEPLICSVRILSQTPYSATPYIIFPKNVVKNIGNSKTMLDEGLVKNDDEALVFLFDLISLHFKPTPALRFPKFLIPIENIG